METSWSFCSELSGLGIWITPRNSWLGSITIRFWLFDTSCQGTEIPCRRHSRAVRRNCLAHLRGVFRIIEIDLVEQMFPAVEGVQLSVESIIRIVSPPSLDREKKLILKGTVWRI